MTAQELYEEMRAGAKGLFVDGKWTWLGAEEGCKCSSRSVLPCSEA
jgi:hypothetical protein